MSGNSHCTWIKKEDSTEGTFEKMEGFAKSYYIKPDKNVAKYQQTDDADFKVEYVPESALPQEERRENC